MVHILIAVHRDLFDYWTKINDSGNKCTSAAADFVQIVGRLSAISCIHSRTYLETAKCENHVHSIVL